MSYFIKFNNISSKGLFKIKKSPTRILANKKIENYNIPTMDGYLYKDYGTYEAYELELECRMIGNFNVENIQRVKEMFKSYEGKLEFSDEEDVYYIARLNNIIPFDETSQVSGEFLLNFIVFPKAYLNEGDKEITVINNQVITNLGNVSSDPILTVSNVSGDFSLSVENNNKKQTMNFTSLNNKTLIINCKLENCYDENKNNMNNNLSLESDFIRLETGDNKITFEPTGAIVKIIPKWLRL